MAIVNISTAGSVAIFAIMAILVWLLYTYGYFSYYGYVIVAIFGCLKIERPNYF